MNTIGFAAGCAAGGPAMGAALSGLNYSYSDYSFMDYVSTGIYNFTHRKEISERTKKLCEDWNKFSKNSALKPENMTKLLVTLAQGE